MIVPILLFIDAQSVPYSIISLPFVPFLFNRECKLKSQRLFYLKLFSSTSVTTLRSGPDSYSRRSKWMLGDSKSRRTEGSRESWRSRAKRTKGKGLNQLKQIQCGTDHLVNPMKLSQSFSSRLQGKSVSVFLKSCLNLPPLFPFPMHLARLFSSLLLVLCFSFSFLFFAHRSTSRWLLLEAAFLLSCFIRPFYLSVSFPSRSRCHTPVWLINEIA